MGNSNVKTLEQMDTPSIIFYEHSFEDPIKVSLVKSVLNLGNECRALAQENTRLKDEVERLNNLIISGGAVTADAQIYTE